MDASSFDRAERGELLKLYCRFWPSCAAYMDRRRWGAVALVLLGALPLGCLFVFHLLVLVLPLLPLCPVFCLVGVLIWPRSSAILRRCSFVPFGRQTAVFVLGRDDIEITFDGEKERRAYSGLSKIVWTPKACCLFWRDGMLAVLPLALLGDSESPASLLLAECCQDH